jgi:hypothetical protein
LCGKVCDFKAVQKAVGTSLRGVLSVQFVADVAVRHCRAIKAERRIALDAPRI